MGSASVRALHDVRSRDARSIAEQEMGDKCRRKRRHLSSSPAGLSVGAWVKRPHGGEFSELGVLGQGEIRRLEGRDRRQLGRFHRSTRPPISSLGMCLSRSSASPPRREAELSGEGVTRLEVGGERGKTRPGEAGIRVELGQDGMECCLLIRESRKTRSHCCLIATASRQIASRCCLIATRSSQMRSHCCLLITPSRQFRLASRQVDAANGGFAVGGGLWGAEG